MDAASDWNELYSEAAAERLRRSKSTAYERQNNDARKTDSTIKAINQYKVVRPLGKGAFGDVLLAVPADAGAGGPSERMRAIKIMRKSALRKIESAAWAALWIQSRRRSPR